MAETFSYEEAIGAAPARRSSTPENFPRVSAEEQRARDAEAARIREGEQTGFPGFVPTSAVIPGSQASPPAAEETFSYEDATKPARASYLVDKPEGAPRTGFVENIKNPWELVTRESLPAHLLEAYKRGTLGEIAQKMREAKAGPPRKGVMAETEGGAVTGRTQPGRRQIGRKPKDTTLDEIIEAVRSDPGKVGAELLNALAADPWMVATPLGAGGRLAAGRVGRMAEAGIVGGGLNAAIEGSAQAAEGKFSLEELEKATALGALLSAPFGAFFKGRKTIPGKDAPKPGPLPRLTDQRPRAERQPEPPPSQAARAADDFLEGEWTRVADEVQAISSKAPEQRAPQETAKLLSFNREWAQANALPAAVGAALATYTLFGEDPENGIIGIGLLGAMKAKGGMWHPKAAETLAYPITGRQAGRHYDPELQMDSMDHWADRSAKTYLNKHMGTETDPLKDIEIPFGEGTKKWGEVSDEIVSSRPAAEIHGDWIDMNKPDAKYPGLERVPDAEQVWEVNRINAAATALRSYLSHVGDYLRQNVAPEKLPQYDLVRAVRETAANDAKVAKEMEKAAAADMKDLPVHKDYGDGMKWVELKLPEALTPEQAKGVVHHETLDLPDLPEYVAVDTQGKPIRNSYTNEYAGADTPQEAWLAGQLAREGNQMGHCVGGYCEGVASGESRIFSLRDAKGRSHVTVEVVPRADDPMLIPKADRDAIAAALQRQGNPDTNLGILEALKKEDPRLAALWQAHLDAPPDISQIKGKQNRAPNKEYIPYVQDFVQSGKWGEVGDFENAQLYDLQNEPRGANPRADADRAAFIEENFGNQRYVPLDELGEAWREWTRGRGGRERGGVDPKLLVGGAAALGAGALAAGMSDDADEGGSPTRNGLIAALAAGALFTVAGRKGVAKTAQAVDYVTGMVSTRLKNISEPLWHRAVDYEWRVLDRVHREMEKIKPQLKTMSRADAQKKVAEAYEAAEQLERSRLFGKNTVFGTGADKLKVQIGPSIGNLIGEEVRLGRLDPAKADEVKSLLLSRHLNADKAMAVPLQHYRNITNAMLLGGSAPIQLGDAIIAAFHQGIVPTIVGVVRAFGPNKPITAREMGLAGHIAQEFDASPTWSAKLLDKTLRSGLFTATDVFGKNVNLNAALFKAERLAQTPAGRKILAAEYEKGFGRQAFNELITELQAKNRQSAQVRSYLFHELSDAQPISKLEMTQAAMDNPNMRLHWQLKSFALKQLDTARREVWNEAKKGTPASIGRAVQKGTALAMTMGLAGMTGKAVSDWLFGNDVELDQGAFLENIAKTYFLGEYTRNTAERGKPFVAAAQNLIPPYQMWDQIWKGDPKAISYLGLPGKIIYQHFLGGAEKENERREKRRLKAEREE